VRGHSVLNEHFVVLFGWSVASPCLHAEHMDNEQEQKIDLFCQYFVQLLRIPENGIVEHNSYQANSYANICYSLWMEH
jgi:hypothetical protein